MNLKDYTFEEALKRVEEIVSELEDGKLPLEESIQLYEEGTKLSFRCKKQLEEAKNRVTFLNSENEMMGDDTSC